MAADSLLIFDMDGVLVEVTESYREAIVRTVEHFTGQRIARGRIQEYKNDGCWNNDWALSQRICADLGVEIEYDTVVEVFNQYFLGPQSDGVGGLIERECWIPAGGLLKRLARRYQLSIFTGRVRDEMNITLRRFASDIEFEPTVCTCEIENGKPHPEGLHKIAGLHPGAQLYYVGDTVADSRSAKAAAVPFIGVAAAQVPRREDLVALFEADGAIAVIEDINQLEAVLPQ